MSERWRRFRSASPAFKIVVDQRNCQVGRALDEADAKIPQGGPEFARTGHIDRANACTKTLEVFFSGLRWQPEASPIGRACTSAGARCRKDEPPLEQPPQCFLDLRFREVSFQLAHEFPKARASRYFLRQCAVEFAVKKELPVLGIEADDVGRKRIDAEIRRELRHFIDVEWDDAAVPGIAFHFSHAGLVLIVTGPMIARSSILRNRAKNPSLRALTIGTDLRWTMRLASTQGQ